MAEPRRFAAPRGADVSTECKRCHGTGAVMAASSAGLRGGKGGQMLTAVPCPDCAPSPALSPEDRAERAWEADYPVTSSAAKREKQTGATRHHFTAAQVKEAFIAGYLARDKEKP